MESKSIGKKVLKGLTQQKAVLAIIVLFVFMAFANPIFYSAYNMMDMLKSTSVLAIIGFGVTIVVICGGVDLSVGGIMMLSGIITIKCMNIMPLPLCILLGLLSGVVVGLINGFLTVKQKTEPFIVTLGMGLVLTGVCQELTDAHPVAGTDKAFEGFGSAKVGGVPSLVIAMFLVLLVTFYILRFTQFGRNCYAIGGDYDVAVYSGINAVRIKWSTYVISGLTAAIGGILLSARLNTASSTYGETTALLVCCGVVVGGTSFSGGVGGVIQTAIGIFLFSALESAMAMLNINIFVQLLVRGIAIVVVIGLDCYARKRKSEDV